MALHDIKSVSAIEGLVNPLDTQVAQQALQSYQVERLIIHDKHVQVFSLAKAYQTETLLRETLGPNEAIPSHAIA